MAECIDTCVSLIQKDLKEKSNIYNWYTAPQVFDSFEEMETLIAKGFMNKAEVPSYIVLRDSEEIYVWDGEKAYVNPKNINRLDYIKNEDEETNPSVLKFSFLDNGKEVISKVWNGNVYPRFVRNNIDLSNSRNKYRAEGVFAPFETVLMDVYINCMEDLVPKIIDTICDCCSNYRLEEGEDEKEYTTVVSYGEKTYNLDYHQTYYRNMRALEAKLKKKTDAYFKSIGYHPTTAAATNGRIATTN